MMYPQQIEDDEDLRLSRIFTDAAMEDEKEVSLTLDEPPELLKRPADEGAQDVTETPPLADVEALIADPTWQELWAEMHKPLQAARQNWRDQNIYAGSAIAQGFGVAKSAADEVIDRFMSWETPNKMSGEDYGRYGLNYMRTRLFGMGEITMSNNEIENMEQDFQHKFATALNMYDAVPPAWEDPWAWAKAGYEIGGDPITWLGAPIGLGARGFIDGGRYGMKGVNAAKRFFGTKGVTSQMPAKAASAQMNRIRDQWLKNPDQKKWIEFAKTFAGMGTESAVVSAYGADRDEVIRENAGMGYDMGNVGYSAGMGFVFGGTLFGIMDVAARYGWPAAKSMWNKISFKQSKVGAGGPGSEIPPMLRAPDMGPNEGPQRPIEGPQRPIEGPPREPFGPPAPPEPVPVYLRPTDHPWAPPMEWQQVRGIRENSNWEPYENNVDGIEEREQDLMHLRLRNLGMDGWDPDDLVYTNQAATDALDYYLNNPDPDWDGRIGYIGGHPSAIGSRLQDAIDPLMLYSADLGYAVAQRVWNNVDAGEEYNWDRGTVYQWVADPAEVNTLNARIQGSPRLAETMSYNEMNDLLEAHIGRPLDSRATTLLKEGYLYWAVGRDEDYPIAISKAVRDSDFRTLMNYLGIDALHFRRSLTHAEEDRIRLMRLDSENTVGNLTGYDILTQMAPTEVDQSRRAFILMKEPSDIGHKFDFDFAWPPQLGHAAREGIDFPTIKERELKYARDNGFPPEAQFRASSGDYLSPAHSIFADWGGQAIYPYRVVYRNPRTLQAEEARFMSEGERDDFYSELQDAGNVYGLSKIDDSDSFEPLPPYMDVRATTADGASTKPINTMYDAQQAVLAGHNVSRVYDKDTLMMVSAGFKSNAEQYFLQMPPMGRGDKFYQENKGLYNKEWKDTFHIEALINKMYEEPPAPNAQGRLVSKMNSKQVPISGLEERTYHLYEILQEEMLRQQVLGIEHPTIERGFLLDKLYEQYMPMTVHRHEHMINPTVFGDFRSMYHGIGANVNNDGLYRMDGEQPWREVDSSIYTGNQSLTAWRGYITDIGMVTVDPALLVNPTDRPVQVRAVMLKTPDEYLVRDWFNTNVLEADKERFMKKPSTYEGALQLLNDRHGIDITHPLRQHTQGYVGAAMNSLWLEYKQDAVSQLTPDDYFQMANQLDMWGYSSLLIRNGEDSARRIDMYGRAAGEKYDQALINVADSWRSMMSQQVSIADVARFDPSVVQQNPSYGNLNWDSMGQQYTGPMSTSWVPFEEGKVANYQFVVTVTPPWGGKAFPDGERTGHDQHYGMLSSNPTPVTLGHLRAQLGRVRFPDGSEGLSLGNFEHQSDFNQQAQNWTFKNKLERYHWDIIQDYVTAIDTLLRGKEELLNQIPDLIHFSNTGLTSMHAGVDLNEVIDRFNTEYVLGRSQTPLLDNYGRELSQYQPSAYVNGTRLPYLAPRQTAGDAGSTLTEAQEKMLADYNGILAGLPYRISQLQALKESEAMMDLPYAGSTWDNIGVGTLINQALDMDLDSFHWDNGFAPAVGTAGWASESFSWTVMDGDLYLFTDAFPITSEIPKPTELRDIYEANGDSFIPEDIEKNRRMMERLAMFDKNKGNYHLYMGGVARMANGGVPLRRGQDTVRFDELLGQRGGRGGFSSRMHYISGGAAKRIEMPQREEEWALLANQLYEWARTPGGSWEPASIYGGDDKKVNKQVGELIDALRKGETSGMVTSRLDAFVTTYRRKAGQAFADLMPKANIMSRKQAEKLWKTSTMRMKMEAGDLYHIAYGTNKPVQLFEDRHGFLYLSPVDAVTGEIQDPRVEGISILDGDDFKPVLDKNDNPVMYDLSKYMVEREVTFIPFKNKDGAYTPGAKQGKRKFLGWEGAHDAVKKKIPLFPAPALLIGAGLTEMLEDESGRSADEL